MSGWAQRLRHDLGFASIAELDAGLRVRREHAMVRLNAYLSIAYAFVLMLIHLTVGPELLGAVEGLLCLVFLVNVLWLRRHQRTTLAASIAAGASLLGVGAGVYIYGGFRSPVMDLFQLLPLLAVTVWGLKVAAVSTVATGAIIIGFWWALPAGASFDPATETSPEHLAYRLLTLLSVVILLEMVSFQRGWVRELSKRTQGVLGGRGSQRLVDGGLGRAQHLASLSQLASGVRHELNTPLAAAMGQLELAMDARRAGEDPTERLRDAREALDSIARVVASLRKYSSGGQQQGSRASLHESAEAALDLMAHDLRHRAEVKVELEAGLEAGGDAGLWTDVFVGLLSRVSSAIEPGRAGQNEIQVVVRSVEGGTEIVIGHTSSASEDDPEAAVQTRLDGGDRGELGVVLSEVLATNLQGTFEVGESPDGRLLHYRMWIPERGLSEQA